MALVHVTFAFQGRAALFPDRRRLRAALHLLAGVAGPATLLFSVVDDHVHLVADAEAAPSARTVAAALARQASAPMDVPHVRPVEGRRHLHRLVGYLLKQPERHGLVRAEDWEGTCLVDLAGARVIPGFALWERLDRALPRLRLAEVLEAGGVAPERVQPATLHEVRCLGAAGLAAACRRALAVAEPASRATVASLSRRALLVVGSEAGLAPSDLCWGVGMSDSAARRARARGLPSEVRSACLRQVRLLNWERVPWVRPAGSPAREAPAARPGPV